MATFISLMNFTDQGIRNVKDSPDRYEAFKAMAEKMGAKVKGVYYTTGHYDKGYYDAISTRMGEHMMKKALVGLLLLSLLISCSSHYIGKQINPSMCHSIDERQGQHQIDHRHLVLDYNYYIDDNSTNITLDGLIRYKPQDIAGGSTILSMTFVILMLDKNRIAVQDEYFVDRKVSSYEPQPFKKTFEMKPVYKYIAISYYGTAD